MKLYIKFLTVFILPFFIFACAKEIVPTLSLSVTQADIANFDGTVEVTVTSNSNWTATVSDIWCTITPTSGNGNGVIKIAATNNNSTGSRTATLLVVCKDLRKTTALNQSYSQLSIDTESLEFDKATNSKVVTITSNTSWQFEIPVSAPWLTASTLSGNGNSTITFTAQANTDGPARSAIVLLKYGSTQKTLSIVQKKSVNALPTVPVMSFPADKATNVQTIPGFTWIASTDPDNDAISYTLYYSKDNLNWTELTTMNTQLYLTSHLSENTLYSWKVKATDIEGGATTSGVFTFTTGLKRGYADGEYKIHQNPTLGNNGLCAEILFIGDGYTAADFQEGGLFEQNIVEGINAFFSVEPYKSYKNYFKVYKQAAYSTDSGVSQADKSIIKNTAFGTSFNGSSSMSTNNDEVFRYAKMIPGVDDAKLKKMLIVMAVNQNRYAGTTFMWPDGRAIAIVPVSRSSTSPGSNYANVILHEGGGHGFGRLADEYINNEGKTLPADTKTSIQNWESLGYYANVDVSADSTASKWKHFYGRAGYERVRYSQGAYYYTFGAWKPEVSSCMIYNEPYYNAPSREAMVKRILTTSGETYDLATFVSKDVVKAPSAPVLLYTKSVNPLLFVPLAPPVFMR